ncbi:hypothetical protein HPP92_010326 [Vanilla planifolia]|uniref:Uncharacterized protein n=1 Tax=Vanilla planifolia TaxID=51239 RepID=A0A835UZM2_VANPL|nr:hypothetical protein HPP92_010326 [Vanilla planifolia]
MNACGKGLEDILVMSYGNVVGIEMLAPRKAAWSARATCSSMGMHIAFKSLNKRVLKSPDWMLLPLSYEEFALKKEKCMLRQLMSQERSHILQNLEIIDKIPILFPAVLLRAFFLLLLTP